MTEAAGRGGDDSGRRVAPGAPARIRPSRRLRGLVLLASLVELLVIIPLVTLALLPLWALAPAALAVVWAFFWVRSAVRAEQALARARRRSRAGERRSRGGAAVAPGARVGLSSRPVHVPSEEVDAGQGAAARGERLVGGQHSEAPTAGAGEVGPMTVESDVEVRASAIRESEVQRSTRPSAQAYDVEIANAEAGDVLGSDVDPGAAAAPSRGDVMVPIVDEDDLPLTWDPVPVPRPTYTMKARAERPEVAPAAVTPDPAPVTSDARGESTAYEQRVAGA